MVMKLRALAMTLGSASFYPGDSQDFPTGDALCWPVRMTEIAWI